MSGITVENSGLAVVVPMNFARDIYNDFIATNKTMEREIKGGEKVVNDKPEVSQK